MTLLEAACLAALAAIGCAAAWLDIRHRLLPHWLCGLAAGAGLAAVLVTSGVPAAGSALLHAVIALAGGFLLFAAGMIGGGDAKYYAAMAAWFPLRDGLFLLVSVTLCGLALLGVWLAWRRSRAGSGFSVPEAAHPFAKLPYGVAISTGAVLSFAMLAGQGSG
jgi:prepilin peptidase CpaA